MSSNSLERFYKRRLNELDQDVRRLQREIQKLKLLKRNGGRAQKHLVRALQREEEFMDIMDEMKVQEFEENNQDLLKEDDLKFYCKACDSEDVSLVTAGIRTVVLCKNCSCRYTIGNEQSLPRSA